MLRTFQTGKRPFFHARLRLLTALDGNDTGRRNLPGRPKRGASYMECRSSRASVAEATEDEDEDDLPSPHLSSQFTFY